MHFLNKIRELIAPKYTKYLFIHNDSVKPIDVFIEPTPDRYLLGPNCKMKIEAVLGGSSFDITHHEGGLTIYAGDDGDPLVLINGLRVESDWATRQISN